MYPKRPQETPSGGNTFHAQQSSLYLFHGEVDPYPRKLFICDDLLSVITTATKENQDIILIGDFNKVIGDDPK